MGWTGIPAEGFISRDDVNECADESVGNEMIIGDAKRRDFLLINLLGVPL